MYKNNEGYPDPTAGRAIRKADKPPEEVINFRRAMKLMSVICHVRILGKVTVVDDKGRRWPYLSVHPGPSERMPAAVINSMASIRLSQL